MPPQHPQTGDILDRALHAARTQAPPHVAANPKLTPDQKGFFGAVAGERSPLNRQSSRIARPFANNAYLGNAAEATVATPAQQAFLGRTNAVDENVKPAARAEGTKIAQEYVKAADTRKTVETRKPLGRGGPGGPITYAQTAPNLAAVGQRALDLAGSGLPFGSAATTALAALSKAGLSPDDRQQVIAGFAKDHSLDDPQAKATLAALTLAKHNSLPANPTTRQLLTAALSPDEHKPSWGDAINPINIAKDALLTPVYAAEGGFALGHASRAAAGGNFDELKAIGNQQAQTFMHPGAFIQEHPFQAALTAYAPIRGAAGVAGKVAGVEATPRLVPLDERLGGGTIDRGDLSTNLLERGAQKASDKLAAKSPLRQSQLIAGGVRSEGNLARIEQARSLKPIGKALVDAGKGVSKQRRNSLLANEASGGTAQEWADHYNRLADESERAGNTKLAKTQRAQAKLRQAQADRFGPEVTQNEQAYLDAARSGADTRTGMLVNTKTPKGTQALGEVSAKWRDYQHNVELRAGQGDTLAQDVVQARNELNRTDPEGPEYGPALDNLGSKLDAYAASTDAKPFRVPTIKPKLVSEFGGPGQPFRANTNPADLVSGLRQSSGGALHSGNYTINASRFTKEIGQPHTLQASIDYVNRVSKKYGRPAVPGEAIPEGMILRNVSNLRTTPKVHMTAEHELDAQAEHLRSVADEFRDPKETGLDAVPDKGNYILLPRAAYDEIAKTVSKVPTRAGTDTFRNATRAYKDSVLFTRIAYPATNFVNSAAQAALGGAGLGSFLRRNSIPLPPGVEDAGFIASDFNRAGREGFRSSIDEAKVSPGLAAKGAALGKGVGRAVDEQYLNRIKTASVAADNVWRKALYVKNALPEARKLAYPDEGTISRLLTRKSASDAAIQEAARAMAEGSTEAASRAAARALKATNDFLGDFGAMKRYPALDLAVPFNSWTRFSGKLLLQTLPLKYPGRTALLYRLGQLGQQATGQQGVLPQYLQESIPFGGSNPLAQPTVNTQRANPFATLGGIAPLDATGKASTENALGNLSPFLAPLLEAFTGNDLETGRVLKDENGDPIKGNPGALARFLGAQALGFIPPLSAITGGGTGRADTSLPLPGLTQNRSKNASGPLLQAAKQPPWLAALNQILPVHVGVRNEHADTYYGNKDLRAALVKLGPEANKRLAKLPGGIEKIQANALRINDELNKNLVFYKTHPDALVKLLENGSK